MGLQESKIATEKRKVPRILDLILLHMQWL